MDYLADASNLPDETRACRKTRLITLIEIEHGRKIVGRGDGDNWMPVWPRVSDRNLKRNVAVWCRPSPLIHELLPCDSVATQRPGQAVHAARVALALNAETLLGGENTLCNGAIQVLPLAGKANLFGRWHIWRCVIGSWRMGSNENKISDGWREGASLRVGGGISWKVRNRACQPFAASHG